MLRGKPSFPGRLSLSLTKEIVRLCKRGRPTDIPKSPENSSVYNITSDVDGRTIVTRIYEASVVVYTSIYYYRGRRVRLSFFFVIRP